jgi:hypothetical protein
VNGTGWVMQLCTTPAARNRILLRFAEQGSGTSLTSARVTDICIEDICVLILQNEIIAGSLNRPLYPGFLYTGGTAYT